MNKNLLNNADRFEFDELSKYLNAKEKLDTIFNKITNYRALYLYDTSTIGGLQMDFKHVFEVSLETCEKLDRVTEDRHINRDHQIFYIEHEGQIFRGFSMGIYKELKLVKKLDEMAIVPKIEIEGYVSYQLERLGGSL